jgi:hypothetical protein
VCTDNKEKYSEKTVEQTVVCHFFYRGRTPRISHIREQEYIVKRKNSEEHIVKGTARRKIP